MRILIISLFCIFFCCKPEIKPQKPFKNNSSNTPKFNSELGLNILESENNLIKVCIKKYYSNHKLYKNELGFWVSNSIEKKQINKYGDEILYSYEIYNLKNKKIYNFNQIGLKKIFLEKESEIRGIEDGLKHLKEGKEVFLFLPSFFAYGLIGDGKNISSNQPIVVKLKIIKINKQLK